LYRTGIRISEALKLYPKDLDRDAGTVRVLFGKRGKARTVGMDSGGFALVDAWEAHRRALSLNGRQPLFCTLRGRRLSADYVRAMLPRLARRAGIDKRVHAHCLRHTHAAELRAERIDIGVICKQLGHASIATTAKYLDHLTPQQVIDAVRGRHWCL
jgi:site-specific recombinase XerD